jgi:hypothetical protein
MRAEKQATIPVGVTPKASVAISLTPVPSTDSLSSDAITIGIRGK